MRQPVSPSLGELKRETEETRAVLTRTVEQLRTSVSDTADDLRKRISPDAIKGEIREYVRSRGERMVADVTAAAQRNPMQAIAVGASVAYPLLRLVRAIPLPVLMVGAGFFFAGTNAGRVATQKASDLVSDLADEANRKGHNISDKIGESFAAAKELTSDVVERTRASATDVKESETDLAKSAADKVGTISTDLADVTREAVSSRGEPAERTPSAFRSKSADLSDRTGKIVTDTIEQNPLLVAGMGLLIGGLIASALPKTELEERVVGEASEAAKRHVQDAASKGFETAKTVAGEIVENVARQAGAEGLTGNQLGAAAKDIGVRVKRVAESAVTTAFDPDSEPNSGIGGGIKHD